MPYIGQEAATTYSTRLAVQQFNGDGSTTAFTLNQSVSADQDILVSVDGVVQDTSAYTVSNGTTLTFSPAPSSGTANIFVNYLGLAVGTVTHPATQGLTATTGAFSGKITADAGIDIDNFNIDGTTIALSSGDMTLDAAGDIILDADGGDVNFKDAGTEYLRVTNGASGPEIFSTSNDGDLFLKGVDGGATITALTLDMSAAGLAIFNAGIAVGGTGAANTLDDYEEGTWTPALASDAQPAGYTTQVGYYRKIGSLVHIHATIQISSIGSFAGAVINLNGLPFTVANLTSYREVGTLVLDGTANEKEHVYLVFSANGTNASLEQGTGNTGHDNNMNANAFDTATIMHASGTYIAS